MGNIKLFSKYVKSHSKTIIFYVTLCLIFFTTFYLYQLPVSAVIYSAALTLFVGIIILIIDFSYYKKRCKRLKKLVSEVSISIENFPETKNPVEDIYKAIIISLYQDKLDIADRLEDKYSDLLEYYTAWAHQIKTPIAAMHLSLQSEDTPLGRELTEQLRRTEMYVDMVLTYLRLDSDYTDYLFKEYSLDFILKQGIKRFSSQFINKKITLIYTPVALNILTDEKWFLIVLEQVLSNALKYTKSGGRIEISVESPMTLCIKDTGIGIAPEDLPRIFEKGYTGYNGRSDKKASGIGLYLSKRICDNLGHKISVISDVGRGTVVKINMNKAKLEIE